MRGNAVSTRNARLAAIHALFSYAAYRHPEHAATISQVMAIPAKRHHRTDLTYLTPPEIIALLAAPDQTTRAGRRYHALMQVAVTAGLRVSELTGLTPDDIHLGTGAHVVCRGKGRKNRATPLDALTVEILRAYTAALPPGTGFVFPTRTGTRMSRDAIAVRLTEHAATASATCPTLASKRITPLSRPGAQCRCCHRSVSPSRSPNPPCQFLGNGLSTVVAVRRGSWVAMGLGSCCPGRRNEKRLRLRSGSTRSRPL